MRAAGLLSVTIAVALAPLRAQLTGGSLNGYIFDPSGAAIWSARITVEDPARGWAREVSTDRSGAWRLSQLPAGVYRVTAARDGFEAQTVNGVWITVDSTRRLDFTLALAGERRQITVTASVLQQDASDSGALLDRTQIEKLPLNRRGFLQLALLTAGVSPPVENSELSSRGSFAAHANGAREEFNNYLLDGVDNNDLYTNRYVMEPPVDTIQEFKIATGSYSAEYARSAGAHVNVITRSGANQFHGLAYEYFRERRLDSRNPFAEGGRNPYVRNQGGGLLSGPLRLNRSFFFANFDVLRERRGLSRLATVPAPEWRDGRLPGLVRDPSTGHPFPANTIPASRIHPLAVRVLDLFPPPTQPGLSGNLLAQPVSFENALQGGGRFDHSRKPGAGLLTLRYQKSGQQLFEPYAEESTDVPGFGSLVDNGAHHAVLHHQESFGASRLHSLRLGFNRATRSALPENYRTNVAALWNAPWLASIDARDWGFPFFNIQGLSPVGDATPLPLLRTNTTYQISEDLSLQRARRLVKGGIQIRHTRANGNVDLLARGSLTFSGMLSGSGAGDLLLGLPSFTLQAKLDNTQTLRTTSYNFYLQDEWRLASAFNVTVGLRYEYNTPPVDPFNRMAVFHPPSARIIRAGTEGISRSGIRPDRNNLAPRFGFAWTPRSGWVVRGGYGLYYDAGMLVLASSHYFNPPFFTLRAFFPTASQLLTLSDPFPQTGGISPVSPSSLSPDLRTGLLQHGSLLIQRQFGSATVASFGYVVSAGSHLIRSRDYNQAPPGPGPVALRRPLPQYGGLVFIETAANSNYHALQAQIDRRFSRRFSLLASYTWSKSIDDASAFLSTKPDKNFPQDSRNIRAERAVSSFDLTLRVTASAVFALPWALELRSISQAQTGQPFTPLLRFDNSNSGNTGGNFGSDRPDLLGNPRLSRRTRDSWFNPGAFSVPPPFTFGSAGRNIIRGPAFAAWDLALARRFRFRERLTATLEAQAFNVLNRTNYDLPERFADEPLSFGRIFSAKAPRQVQIALRLGF